MVAGIFNLLFFPDPPPPAEKWGVKWAGCTSLDFNPFLCRVSVLCHTSPPPTQRAAAFATPSARFLVCSPFFVFGNLFVFIY